MKKALLLSIALLLPVLAMTGCAVYPTGGYYGGPAYGPVAYGYAAPTVGVYPGVGFGAYPAFRPHHYGYGWGGGWAGHHGHHRW